MKNIKLKIFTMLSLVLFQTQSYGQAEVVAAIQDLKSATVSAIQGSGATKSYTDSVIGVLNKIFVGGESSGEQSDLDKKVDLYVKSFYSLYTTPVIVSSNKSATKLTEFEKNYKEIETIKSTVDKGLNKLLTNELSYYVQANANTKDQNLESLVNADVEWTGNVAAGSSNALSGVLGFETDVSADAESKINALNIDSLLGPDGYANEKAEQRAQWFMAYIFQIAPPPQTFFIPPQKNNKASDVTIYLPYSTDPNKNSVTVAGDDYAKMTSYLSNDSTYKEYKEKYRILLALQTIFHNTFLNFYQERIKVEDKDSKASPKSLIEKEKKMAKEGLEIKYDDLKKKTVADINLETLNALNKIVYFLQKIHQDNERTQLMLTISTMQMQTLGTKEFKDNYIIPISKTFEYKCWEGPKSSDSADRTGACGFNKR